MTAAAIDAIELEDDLRVAEVVAIYAHTVFDVRHCAHGVYTIGDATRASFPLLSGILPDPHSFPLVRSTGHAIALRFTADMRGELIEGTRRSSLDELIASGRATPVDGAFTVELAPGARGVIALESVTFHLRSVSAAHTRARPDRRWWLHAVAAYLVLYTLLVLAYVWPHFADTLLPTRWPVPTQHIRFAPQPVQSLPALADSPLLAAHLQPTHHRIPAAPHDAPSPAPTHRFTRTSKPSTQPITRPADQIAPLSPADVRRILEQRAPILRRCGPLGGASVHFTIDGAGIVTAVAVAGERPREVRVAHCVAGQLRRTWFPRGVGSLHATYPLPPAP